MSFLGKANFCTSGHSQLQCLCHVIQGDMLTVYHSPTHLFSHVHFSLSSLHQLEQLSHLQQSPVPLQFPLPDVVIATDPHLLIGSFIFRDLVYLYQLVNLGQVPCVGLILPCRSFRPIAMMLHRMAFHLSGKAVALYLDNGTAKAYLCNEGGTVSPFPSRLACWILSLTDKQDSTLIPVYIPTHLPGPDASRVASSPLGGSSSFSPLGSSSGGPAGILLYHSMPALLHLGISTTSGALGLNAFNHLWTFQVSYVFPPPALVPLVVSKFLAEHVKDQLRYLILVAPCWMEAPWLPTVVNMLADFPWQCPIIEDLIMDVLVGQMLKGLPYLHLTLWLLSDGCYADRGSLPSVYQMVVGAI